MHRTLVTLPVLLASTVAQTTWVVPSGTTDLTPYIQQAAPGDTLVLSGQVNGFTLNKGLTVLGPATIGLGGGFPNPVYNDNTVQIAVPAGQEARLVDLTMTGSVMSGFFAIGGNVLVQQGNVTLDHVALNGGGFQVAGTVKMLDCNATPLAEGAETAALLVTSGLCVLTRCSLQGSNQTFSYSGSPVGSKPGIVQTGGVVHASNTTVNGGHRANFPSLVGNPTAWVASGGTAFVADSTLTGGNGFAANPPLSLPGGSALEVSGGALVSVARSTLTNGAFWTGTAPTYQNAPELVGMTRNAAPTRGQTFTATATAGNSQELLGLVGGFDGTLAVVAPIAEPLCGAPGQLVTLTLAIPAAGAQVVFATPVPNVVALRGAAFWVQAVQLANGAVHASPATGGTIR